MHLYLFTYRPTIVLYIRAQYLLENLVDVSFQTHNLYSKRSMPAFLSKKHLKLFSLETQINH